MMGPGPLLEPLLRGFCCTVPLLIIYALAVIRFMYNELTRELTQVHSYEARDIAEPSGL